PLSRVRTPPSPLHEVPAKPMVLSFCAHQFQRCEAQTAAPAATWHRYQVDYAAGRRYSPAPPGINPESIGSALLQKLLVSVVVVVVVVVDVDRERRGGGGERGPRRRGRAYGRRVGDGRMGGADLLVWGQVDRDLRGQSALAGDRLCDRPRRDR